MTTTTPKKSILNGVLFEALMIGSFAAWQLQGSEGARNVFLFAAWALSCLTIVASLAWISDKDYPDQSWQPWLYRQYIQIRTPVLLTAMVWIGMIGLAATFAVAWLLVECARYSTNKAKGGAA